MSSILNKVKMSWPFIRVEWQGFRVQLPVKVREAGDAFVAAMDAWLADEAKGIRHE